MKLTDNSINLEELAGKYPLLRSVIDGDTTLEETLCGYEKEFYELSRRGSRLIRLRDKNLEDDIRGYESRMNDLISIIEKIGFSRVSAWKPNIYDYIKQEGVVKKVGLYRAGAILLAFGYVTIPLTFELWDKYDRDGRRARDYIKLTKDRFGNLGEKAREADSTIRKRYITKYMKDRPELFRETYLSMSREEQRQVQNRLEEMIDLGAMDMSVRELEDFLRNIKNQ